MASVIALIGGRGSGKSTIGARLAESLGRPFVDLDERALALTGASTIRDVFARSGEAAWRQAEAQALAAVLDTPGVVLATGGGVPCVDPVRYVLRAARQEGRIHTIWLKCDGRELARRLTLDEGDRPSLTGDEVASEAVAMAAARADAYEAAADVVVDGGGSLEEVLEAVGLAVEAMDS